MVAAFSGSLPDDAVCLALDLLAWSPDGGAARIGPAPESDVREALAVARRLETSSLSIVEGRGDQHGAIWLDGSTELFLDPPERLLGEALSTHLPTGEGEAILRRLIDDSINLLTPLELNRRREGEGFPPLNLLWPWGAGWPDRLRNLSLRIGAPIEVASGSLRLAGLSRLAGCRHVGQDLIGHGINIRFGEVGSLLRGPVSIVVLDAPGRLREEGRLDEAAWVLARFDEEFLGPQMDEAAVGHVRIAVFAPGFEPRPSTSPTASPRGIGALYDSNAVVSNVVPFDERALEERLPVHDLWKSIERTLRSDEGELPPS